MNDNEKTLLSFEELSSSVHASFIGNEKNKQNFYFSSVATDSRNVCAGTLFIPLVGEFQDGHKYIDQAIEKGASVIFISQDENNKNGGKYSSLAMQNEKVCFFCVKNNLKALQDAARCYVEKFPDLIKIGITGSSGKTTTKELVVSVLKQKYNVVYTQGNFNSETGLPLSVFNIRKEHECGVFEMGMNRKNEILEIADVLKPNYAVITNIGTAHIGILGSRKNIAIEKRHIYEVMKKDSFAFVPYGDDFFDFLSQGVKGRVVPYGDGVSVEESHVEFVKDEGLAGTVFKLDGTEIHLNLSGKYNYKNALAAVAVGRHLGINVQQIKAGIESMNAVSGRMETIQAVLRNGKHVQIIKDCYNANPDSMGSVLEFCKNLNAPQKIYILGDMLELGETSIQLHKDIGRKIRESMPSYLILFGKEMKNAFDELSLCGNSKNLDKIRYFKNFDTDEIEKAASFVLENAEELCVILIKASRGLSLERVVEKIISDGVKE